MTKKVHIVAVDPHLPTGMEVEASEERADELIKSGLYVPKSEYRPKKKSRQKGVKTVSESLEE